MSWMRGEVEAGAVAGLGSGLLVGLVVARLASTASVRDAGAALSVLGEIRRLPPEVVTVVALGYGAALGALFGWIHRGEWLEKKAGLVHGMLFGVTWGLVAVFVAEPALHGLFPLSPGALALVRPALLLGLVGHVAYGVLVGLGFSTMTYRVVGR